ncbi:hypothetical protein DAEQUDRAFT_214701 [Daedalea quercina L-15889]|uniref:Uncharacterized protein n=1 Tax=Daedalea quercina L-15889 TaxID=1314783 RepID=A0A165R3D9_9APHY|nr:hypothetical protein DAEQUDRAFT_214701 [Daedalea quercina L-15889]
MPSYLGPLSPISPLSRSLVGLPWSTPDGQESDPSPNEPGPSQPRSATASLRPSSSRVSNAAALHGPRAPHRSMHASNENRRPRNTGRTLQVCTTGTLRPLPAPPPCTPVTPITPVTPSRSTYRPLPRPPSQPVPLPRAPVSYVDSSFEHELRVSKDRVLRLVIPDSPEAGIIIVSPLTGSPEPSAPSLNEAACTQTPRVDETGRWATTCQYTEGSSSQYAKPTLPRIDTHANAHTGSGTDSPPSVNPIAFAHPNVLSPIEKYYDNNSAVLGEVNGSRTPPRRPTNELYDIVDVPLREAGNTVPAPASPRGWAHSRVASDLSKKLKRYSCKWIREKKGKRWVEEDYGQVLQKLRRLK